MKTILDEQMYSSTKMDQASKLFDSLMDKLPSLEELQDEKSTKNWLDNNWFEGEGQKAVSLFEKEFKTKIRIAMKMDLGNSGRKDHHVSVNEWRYNMKKGYVSPNASVFIPNQMIADINNQVMNIVADGETGFQIINPTKGFLDVVLNMSTLYYFKHPEWFSLPEDFFDGYDRGRLLTSIILHEIGHVVFLPFELKYTIPKNKQEISNTYSIKIPNIEKTIIIPQLNKNDPKSKGILKKILYPLLVLATKSADRYNSSDREYNRIEGNANVLPVEYGYAKENAIIDSSFQRVYNKYHQPNKFQRMLYKYIKYSSKDADHSVGMNAMYLIRGAKSILEEELKQADNPRDKKLIKEQIKAVSKIIQDLVNSESKE